MANYDILELTAADLVGDGVTAADQFQLRTKNTYDPNYLDDPRVSIIIWRNFFDALASIQASESLMTRDVTDIQRMCIYFERNDVTADVSISRAEFEPAWLENGGTFQPRVMYFRHGEISNVALRVNGSYMGEDLSKHFSTDTESEMEVSGSNIPGNHFVEANYTSAWIASNMPMFEYKEDAEYYMRTSEIRNLWNGTEEDAELSPSDTYYYYNMRLFETETDFESGRMIEEKQLKIYISDGKLSGFTDDNIPHNVQLIGDPTKITKLEVRIGGQLVPVPVDEIFNHYLTYTRGNNVITDGTKFYYANVSTNIYIATNEDDAREHLGDKNPSNTTNRTGSEIDKTENSNAQLTNDMCHTYILNQSQLSAVASDIYSNDSDIIDRIKESFTMYNNPIDFVQSVYYLPFNPRAFCNTHTHKVYLGSQGVDGTESASEVRYSHMTNICNVYIAETFGNFLDYTNVKTLLYLPYCSIANIDYGSIIRKHLSIDVGFDAVNGTIKYYIKADGKLIMYKEANVGRHITVTGADNVSKSREIANASLNFITSGTNLLAASASGNYLGMISNALGSATSGGQLANVDRVAMIQSGSSSSGVSSFDPTYPFLIFDIQGAVIPEKLYENYGRPCNRIAKLSTCSGYTEVADVHLVGDMLPEVRDRIERDLKTGVIF